MKILITGGTGFIGSHLVEKLQEDHELILLVNDKDLEEKSTEKVTYIYQDLTEKIELPTVKSIDGIIHLAQGNHRTIEGVRTEFQVNVTATLELLEFARTHSAKKFILASSGVVYGFGPHEFVETDPLNAVSLYGATKIAAESLLWQYREYFDCDILRFFFPYGPGTPPNQLFGKLVANIQNGEDVQIKNDGEPRINPIYIDDLTDAIAKVVQLEQSTVVNLGGAETYSIWEITNKIGEILGKSPKLNEFKEGPIDQNMIGSIEKAKELIDFEPKISLDEGLKRLIVTQGK
jgi:nucleoside-diphosphate-sugar epimerase